MECNVAVVQDALGVLCSVLVTSDAVQWERVQKRFKRLIYAVEFERGRTPTVFSGEADIHLHHLNLIYCIHCSSCGLLYIGKTKRRLDDCFPEHLRSIRPNLPDLPVAEH